MHEYYNVRFAVRLHQHTFPQALTYQYAAAVYSCIKTCMDAMHFRAIPEKSENSYLLEAEIFTVLRSLVDYNFQIWLVVGNSVTKLSDICHKWRSSLWLQINTIFSSLYHNHFKFRASLS